MRLAVLVALVGCATPSGPAQEAVACTTMEDCREHPRECRLDLEYACETCAGQVFLCASRTERELAELDQERERCESAGGGMFSYLEGCLCEEKPCESEERRCEERGGTYLDGICVVGALRTPR